MNRRRWYRCNSLYLCKQEDCIHATAHEEIRKGDCTVLGTCPYLQGREVKCEVVREKHYEKGENNKG